MTMKSEGLNLLAPDCFVEIAREDAEVHGVDNDDLITLASRRGAIQAKAKISEVAVGGTVFIPFHYAEAAANRLTNGALDPISKIPEYKVCAVRIEKQ
jgi:predicted molibdopterin-dependent oxidoreductase YjgC